MSMVEHHRTAAEAAMSNGMVVHVGTASAITIWGLSLGDLGVLISMAASVLGVAIQAYMAYRKVRRDRRDRQSLRRGD